MQLDLFQELKSQEEAGVRQKKCYVCEETKPHIKQYFDIGVSTKSGLVHLKGLCKSCSREGSRIAKELRSLHLKDKTENCDCCGWHVSEVKRDFHLDHCYKTGRFRGWLCPQCNRGIGNLGESVEGLEKAISYLRKHDERS